MKDLRELIKSKQDQARGTDAASEPEKRAWLERIDELYDTIERWLRPVIDDGDLTVHFQQVAVREELLGLYHARAMTLLFYNDAQITFYPKGLNVIGAKGRIDVTLGAKQVKLVGDPDTLEWKIANVAGTRIELQPFSEEVFNNLIAEFIEGF